MFQNDHCPTITVHYPGPAGRGLRVAVRQRNRHHTRKPNHWAGHSTDRHMSLLAVPHKDRHMPGRHTRCVFQALHQGDAPAAIAWPISLGRTLGTPVPALKTT